MTTKNTESSNPAQWHAAFPSPKNTNPQALPRSNLLQWLRDGQLPGSSFVLVDLRRDDHEGGTIKGSLNLPAQSLYPSIATLYSVFTAANIEKVIFYCGSCGGRGTRAAGWFDDYLKEQKDSRMQSYILEGGIKGWVAAGEEYTVWMSDYNGDVWGKKLQK